MSGERFVLNDSLVSSTYLTYIRTQRCDFVWNLMLARRLMSRSKHISLLGLVTRTNGGRLMKYLYICSVIYRNLNTICWILFRRGILLWICPYLAARAHSNQRFSRIGWMMELQQNLKLLEAWVDEKDTDCISKLGIRLCFCEKSHENAVRAL